MPEQGDPASHVVMHAHLFELLYCFDFTWIPLLTHPRLHSCERAALATLQQQTDPLHLGAEGSTLPKSLALAFLYQNIMCAQK